MRTWLIAVLALAAAMIGGAALAQAPACGTITTCPVATPPLDGTEVVLGVQQGKTVQIPTVEIINAAVSVGYPRASIPSQTIGPNKTISVAGYYVTGDLGAGAIYTSNTALCSSAGIQAIQDAGGTWFCLVLAGEAPVGQFGAYLDYAKNQYTGTISGNTLTMPTVGYGKVIGDPMAIGMTIGGAGVTAATITAGSGGSWTISGSPQTVGPVYMYATSGHDDTVAINAASQTNLTMTLGGLPCAGGAGGAGTTSWAGVSSTISLNHAFQHIVGNGCTGIAALPNFTVGGGTLGLGYVVSLAQNDQTADGLVVDAGEAQGVSGLGGLYLRQGTDRVRNYKAYHFGGAAIANGAQADNIVDGFELTEWNNSDPQFPDQTQQHGVGVLCQVNDNVFTNGIIRWTRYGIYQTSDPEVIVNGAAKVCTTTVFSNIHVYNGLAGFVASAAPSGNSYNSGTGIVTGTLSTSLPLQAGESVNVTAVVGSGADLGLVSGLQTLVSGTGGTTVNFSVGTGHTISITSMTVTEVFINPVDIQIDAASGGSALYRGVYLDDGTVEDYNTYQSLQGIYPLVNPANSSVFSPTSWIRVYGSGVNDPFGFNLGSVPSTSLGVSIGYGLVNLLTNPNLLTATAATDGAGHVTYTLTTAASVTGSIAANVMTVTAGSNLMVGGLLSGSGVVTNTRVVAQLTGSAGGIGTYTISPNQTAGSTTITQASWALNAPQPAAGNGGFITASGCSTTGHNGTFPIYSGTATTSTAVTVINATGGTSTGCSIQFAWAGDATIINAYAPNTAQVYETSPRIIINTESTANTEPQEDVITLARTTYGHRYNLANGGYCLDRWNTSASALLIGCGATGTSGIAFDPVADAASGFTLGDTTHRWFDVFSLSYGLAAALWESATNPTVTSGLGTSPTVAASCSTASCRITVGTGSPSTTIVIGMPTGTNDWACTMTDATSNVTFRQTNSANASQVTYTASGAPTAGDLLRQQCAAN